MKIYEIGTGYTPIPAQMGATTEIVVEELVKAFQMQNVDVSLLDIQARDRKENTLPIIEVPVPGCFSGTDVQLGILHKLKRVAYSISLAGTLKKILRESTEQVILHFHNQYNLFFFLKLVSPKLRARAKIAYTVHSYVWHNQWDQIAQTVRKRYFQELCCIENADYVFVLNEQTRQNIIAHLDVTAERVHLIDNGVNISRYTILDEEEKQAELKHRNMVSGKVFIQVGSVCRRKNQLAAVELLLPLMKKDKEICFCYAGGIIEQDYKEEIESFAKENGVDKQVLYMGELCPGKQLNLFYNLACAMVFPSKAEGFSLVIIEAMAAGVPVLISQKLQFRLADQCIRYENADNFVKIVQEMILDNPMQLKLSTQVRETVVKQFGWEKIASDYMRIWKKQETHH